MPDESAKSDIKEVFIESLVKNHDLTRSIFKFLLYFGIPILSVAITSGVTIVIYKQKVDRFETVIVELGEKIGKLQTSSVELQGLASTKSGPLGPKGEKGDKGPQGEAGQKGEDASKEIIDRMEIRITQLENDQDYTEIDYSMADNEAIKDIIRHEDSCIEISEVELGKQYEVVKNSTICSKKTKVMVINEIDDDGIKYKDIISKKTNDSTWPLADYFQFSFYEIVNSSSKLKIAKTKLVAISQNKTVRTAIFEVKEIK